jgi:hypothetical protein
MKVYISGPITGIKNLNKELFDLCEKVLVDNYHIALNPLKAVPFKDNKTYGQYMREDLKNLLECDAIIMLSDWRKSKGATLELKVAQMCGMRLWKFEDHEIELLELRGEEL